MQTNVHLKQRCKRKQKHCTPPHHTIKCHFNHRCNKRFLFRSRFLRFLIFIATFITSMISTRSSISKTTSKIMALWQRLYIHFHAIFTHSRPTAYTADREQSFHPTQGTQRTQRNATNGRNDRSGSCVLAVASTARQTRLLRTFLAFVAYAALAGKARKRSRI